VYLAGPQTRFERTGIIWGIAERHTVGLALVGLVCSGLAVLGVALAVSPITPGRLAYYALVAGGSAPRLAVLASIGCVLAAPATLRSHRPRWLAVTALGAGAFAATLGAVLSAAIVWEARSHELSVSLRDNLFGARRPPPAAPELVTFATGAGWQLDADLYRPPDAGSGNRRAPAVIVVHGGAWRSGDKNENPAWNQWLAARGYVVLDIQYRLAPAANWRQAVGDIWSAVAWLRSHAAELGADPDRVAVLGRSAGGHLALLAAYAADDADLENSGNRPPPLWCVIAFYAPTDLTRMYMEACRDPTDDVCTGLRALIGSDPAADGDAYRLASPLEHVHAAAPPTLLIHGTSDRVVPPEHSRLLAGGLAQAGARVQLVSVPFAPHAFDLVPDALGTQLARAAMAAFLDDIS
jgi:acetyl esterase/lipase